MNEDYVKPPEQPKEYVPFGPNAKFVCFIVTFTFVPLGLFILGYIIYTAVTKPMEFKEALGSIGFAVPFLALPTLIAIEARKRLTERIVVTEDSITLMSRGKPKIAETFENIAELKVLRSNYGYANGYLILFKSGKRFDFSPDIDHLTELISTIEERTKLKFLTNTSGI